MGRPAAARRSLWHSGDNSLALYRLSGRISTASSKFLVSGHYPKCTQNLFLGSDPLRSPASSPSASFRVTLRRSRRRKRPRPATAATPAKPLYSAERSLSRKATLARGRAIATAREMADTVLPRYKVDANGELVPDVRAAAAIIYDPETNQVLWEENSQDQRSIASITKVMTATVFLGEQPGPDAAGHDRTQRRLPGVDDVSARQRSRDGRRSAAPAAHPVRQRGGSRAGAHLAVRLGRVRPPDEREGRGAGPPEHELRRSVGPAVGQRVVGVRHGAAHHARVGRRADCVGHADAGVHRAHRQAHGDHPQHESSARAGRRRCAGGQDRLHLEVRLLPGDAAAAPRSGQQVAVVVLGARSNAARFMETQNLFTWLSTKAPTLFSPQPQVPQPLQ